MKTMFKQLFNIAIVFAISGLVLSSCKDDVEPVVEPDLSGGINLSSAGYLVDDNNQTLYIFSNDVAGANTCAGGCTAKWPVYSTDNVTIGSGLDEDAFAEIALADGTKQTTYNGWPLYYFSPTGDGVLEATGATSGEGVGGVWFVAKKYDLMLANTQLVGHDGVNYTSDYAAGDGATMYFTDGKGNTLYTFKKDFKDTNNFTAADFSNDGVWPIYYSETTTLPSAMNAADFGEIDVFGKMQLTYKGWPLYYFGQDAETRGNNKGISFPAPGVWPIANATTVAAVAQDLTMFVNLSADGFLVDGNNQTLYIFSNDVAGTNNCAGGCTPKWPVFYNESITLGDGLDATDFAEITLGDASKQRTYKGWPLYYFSPNGDGTLEATGATSGEGVAGVWYVAKEYDLMLANTQLVGHDGMNYTSDYAAGDGATMYFTDGNGNTLYTFKKDFKDVNNFTAADLSNNGVWPIYYSETTTLPSAMNAADFGKIDVFGNMQLTYKGWPLYYFGQDAETRGNNKGISFPAPGVWPIANASTVAAADAPTVILSDNGTFGNIITDSEGRSLYFFTKDVNGLNHCEGGCQNVWPVFYTETITLKAGSTLDAGNFSEITLADGTTKQNTYKGWPLYYFSPTADGVVEEAGLTAGDGVNNVWYIAKPAYSLMIADAQLVGHDGVNYTSDYTSGDGVTKYFVDAMGNTLYVFKNDKKDTNNFTAADFSNDGVWPIYHTSIVDLPSGMNAADFGEITVFGRMQLTYKGWPVYYFGQDAQRGDNKGISFPAPGVWPIINNSTTDAPL